MGFHFDAPISHSTSAYDKTNRRRTTDYTLPSSKNKKTPALLDQLRSRARRPFGMSGDPYPSRGIIKPELINPTPAKESRLFQIPLSVRQKIYGYIVGQGELLHILLRYRAAPSRWRVAYRRCGADGLVENCVLKNCKEFHDLMKGSYYGYFDHVSGLFLTCREM